MAAIIREQAVAKRDRRNQRAAQKHMRAIDAVIGKTLADRSDAAARLRQEAGSKLDAILKNGVTIEPPKTQVRADDPARFLDAAPRLKTPKRAPPDRDR